jgi:hypothetical protein
MADDPNSTTITIRRTSQLAGLLCKFAVWANNQQIGTISNGQTAQFSLPPGQHSVFLKLTTCKSDTLTLTLKPGDDVPLVCGSDAVGWRNLIGLLYQISGNAIDLAPSTESTA